MSESKVRYLPPVGPLDATLIRWRKGKRFHHVHHERFRPNEFNPSVKGNSRFNPIFDKTGSVIPTWYAGITKDCALMETVFHDVPYLPGEKTLWKDVLLGMMCSQLVTSDGLLLVDLGTISLRKLGIERAHLIDTSKAYYADSRVWAETLYVQFPKAQGLKWRSRQDDSAEAVILFGTRVEPGSLEVTNGPYPILANGQIDADTIALARRIGLRIIDTTE